MGATGRSPLLYFSRNRAYNPTMTDLLLTNGKIYTMNPTRPRAHAIAFASGRVVAFDDDAIAARTARTETIDLRGRAVIPGLVDHHIHFTGYAMGIARVQLDGARSLEEAVARVAARVKIGKTGRVDFRARLESSRLDGCRHSRRKRRSTRLRRTIRSSWIAKMVTRLG